MKIDADTAKCGAIGWPYRVFLSTVGAVVVMLSVTGAVAWWKKRQARRHLRAVKRGHRPRLRG